jgi:hypothetical protein
VLLHQFTLFTVVVSDEANPWTTHFPGMSSPPTNSPAYHTPAFPCLLLAQSQQEILDVSQQQEMASLLRSGSHADRSSDFTVYVVLPVVVCLGLIVLGRRFF